MYVTRVPNRSSPPAVLLRESYRDGGKVKTRTLANLSDWPDAKVEALRLVLKGEIAVLGKNGLQIERSLPHGHVAAALGVLKKLKLDGLLAAAPERLLKLVLAMIVARVIEPAAKLATARQLSEGTAAHSLGAVLDLGAVDEDELYAALDLLREAQPRIEATLARRHLAASSFTISHRAILRAASASWAAMATAATARRISCRSSSGCSVRQTAALLRWKCSRAIPAIPPPLRYKWRS
jgi:hypothetical protein